MRIAHITDIHVTVPPKFSQLFGKRMLGTLNLYVFGRNSHFSQETYDALDRALAEHNPDVLLVTGDITSQATPQEFDAALKLWAPIFERQPTVLMPGNHDVYTRDAVKNDWMQQRFAQWMGEGPWPRVHKLNDFLSIIAVQVCRPDVLSSGKISTDDLERLDQILSEEKAEGRTAIVAAHYPIRGRDGKPHGPRSRAIVNKEALEAVLSKYSASITAFVHGHEHHGYQTLIPGQDGCDIPSFDPGSSGYAWMPEKRRTAHFNIYEVSPESIEVKRFTFKGDERSFIPEDGGAYASGR
jgi:3',5'-cyclic AMP phosphodiesterase CpdA